MNKVIIIGHLGQDPEKRVVQGGQIVARLHVATSRKYTNKNNNELVEETEWHRCSAWGKIAEFALSYCPKGRQVCVEGRLRTTSYDKDGQKHYTTEIVVEQLKGLGPSPNKRGGPGQQDAGGPPDDFIPWEA